METLSPLVPFPSQDDQVLAAIASDLEEFHKVFLTGTLYQQFKRANPGEAGRLETYWVSATPYPSVSTATGIALRYVYHAHHQSTGWGGPWGLTPWGG